MAETPKEFVSEVETPNMAEIASMLGGSMLLLTFMDDSGREYTAAAISGQAIGLDDATLKLHETKGAGLRLTDFKVVLP